MASCSALVSCERAGHDWQGTLYASGADGRWNTPCADAARHGHAEVANLLAEVSGMPVPGRRVSRGLRSMLWSVMGMSSSVQAKAAEEAVQQHEQRAASMSVAA